MSFIGKILITAITAFAAHVGIIMALAGGSLPASTVFLQELAIRWTIAAIFAHSVAWRFPVFLNGLIVGVLMAVNMAFIVYTFQGEFAFFQRALLTNGTGAVGLAIGAGIAAAFLGRR